MRVLVVLMCFVLLVPAPALAGYCGYPYYPSYSSYSYSYCAPVSYCEPSYCWEPAGWYRGRWYPAGQYAWVNGCYYLKGYGPHHGYCDAPYDDYRPSFTRFSAVIPLVDLPTYSAQYLPGVVAGATAAPTALSPATPGNGPPPVPNAPTAPVAPALGLSSTMASDITEMKRLLKIVADGHQSSAIRLDRIEKRLQTLEGRRGATDPPALPESPDEPPPAPPAPAPRDDGAGLGVLRNRCATCHQEGSKNLAKDAPVLLTVGGQTALLGDKDVASVDKVLTDGSMPPKKTGIVLTDGEKEALRRLFGIQR